MVCARLVRDFRSTARLVFSLGTLASAIAQPSTYVATTYAGGGSANIDGPVEAARFCVPKGIAIDREGDVYVADSGNGTVRRISHGVVTTLAGSIPGRTVRDGIGPTAKLVPPEIIAVDGDRNVYLASTFDRTIQRITPAGVVTTLASGASLGGGTYGMALDSAKNVYAATFGPPMIRRISPDGITTSLIGSGTLYPDIFYVTPHGIAVGADDSVHVFVDRARWYKITTAGKVSQLDIPGYYGSVHAMALDQAGNAVVVDSLGYEAITKITPAGVVSVLAYDENNRFASLYGVAVDPSGSVLVTDGGAHSILQIAADGAVSKLTGFRYYHRDGPAENALLDSPYRITADAKGNVYVVAGALRRIDAQRNVATFQSSAAGFVPLSEPPNPAPIGYGYLATDRDGNLYTSGYALNRISPTGVVTTLAGTAGISGTADGQGANARFSAPSALAVDDSGNVFVADGYAVRKISPAGAVTTIAGSIDTQGTVDGPGLAARFVWIRGIAAIGDTVYIADVRTVRKITAAGVVTTIAGAANISTDDQVDGQGSNARFSSIQGMTSDGANLYVADEKVRKVTPDGSVTTVSSVSGTSIAADLAGNIFLTASDNRIYKLSSQPFSPSVELQPRGYAVPANASFSLTARGAGNPTPTMQWQQNGRNVDNAAAEDLALPNLQPAQAGIYRAVFTNTQGAKATQPSIVGVTTTAKVLGAGRELEPRDIRHPNGNVFDQVLLEGAAAAVTADYSPDPTRNQITRVSFVDLDDDIVQVEFSGPGTLSIVLDSSSGPALPVNYEQNVNYMKGHAGIVIAGATEQTNVSIFSVGRATAINQALFKSEVDYGGMADLAFIAISSANGRFGGLRAANASFYATRGLTGIHAPGVVFEGPVYVGNISAYDAASPVLQVGRGQDVRITGGDLFQANGRSVEVSGIARLLFTAGGDSHGKSLPARNNRATLVTEGRDVTAEIVAYP